MAFNIVSNRRVRIPFTRRRVLSAYVVLTFGVIGFVLPFICGLIRGFPVAHVQDELSYVLAADTYAHFRVTNPTPAYFESFESPHVIIEPSYISKYPPAQGLFMAFGKLVFGNFIFGVWLSCGLAAASLFWMLLGWTRPTWAIIGTALMIGLLGVTTYWAQSFWGGMVATAGGALFFGGFRRLFKRLTVGSTVWMTIGGIILINSRPFEGTMTMIVPLAVLTVWLVRDRRDSISQKLKRVILPGAALAAIAISMMGYQYYRVTGSPLVMPYTVHHAQYYPTPLFIFQKVNETATRGNERLRHIYETYTSPPILDSMKVPGMPYLIYLSPVYGLAYLAIGMPLFLLSPFLLALLYLTLPTLLTRSRWFLVIVASCVFTFLVMSLGIWWDQYHYSAPLTCCLFLLVAEGMRLFYIKAVAGRQRLMVGVTLAVMSVAGIIFQQFYTYSQHYMEKDFTADRELVSSRISAGSDVEVYIPDRGTFFKAELENIVAQLPDDYIAIVSYDSKYSIHDELVFNGADFEHSKLLWAHDLGAEKNARMLRHYDHRRPLLIRLEESFVKIRSVHDTESASWYADARGQLFTASR